MGKLGKKPGDGAGVGAHSFARCSCRWHDCKSIASKHPHGHEFFAFPTQGQFAGSTHDFGMWLNGIGYEHADIWAPSTSAGSMLQLSEERKLPLPDGAFISAAAMHRQRAQMLVNRVHFHDDEVIEFGKGSRLKERATRDTALTKPADHPPWPDMPHPPGEHESPVVRNLWERCHKTRPRGLQTRHCTVEDIKAVLRDAFGHGGRAAKMLRERTWTPVDLNETRLEMQEKRDRRNGASHNLAVKMARRQERRPRSYEKLGEFEM